MTRDQLFTLRKSSHQGDIETPVHAGHQEPQASSRDLVQDVDGRIAQHLLRVAPVIEHAADAAVDDFSEVAVERADSLPAPGERAAASDTARAVPATCAAVRQPL